MSKTESVTYVMGIDGGGSTVRAAVVNSDLQVCGASIGPTVNPNLVGHDASARAIQAAMREALAQAGLSADEIVGVGIGVAGAEMWYAEAWLREVIAAVFPAAYVVPSADHEIALVGAHGQHRGILVLAGTGSLACGVGQERRYHLVGAKGYLLGDEGSGYWIGLEGLRAVIRAADGRGRKTTLVEAMLGRLGLKVPDDLLSWLYQSGGSRTRDVAKLAGVVMEQAEGGDAVSREIVLRAAQELALAVRSVQFLLKREPLPIAFAGGLLTHDTPLSRGLCDLIGLTVAPQPRYTPVIGGAIMALEGLGLRSRSG